MKGDHGRWGKLTLTGRLIPQAGAPSLLDRGAEGSSAPVPRHGGSLRPGAPVRDQAED
ncbi:MAG: hypothetical protein BIP78_0157 [Candidatus Bipolaricaulis sibiricus]|uniref:Uncharacterized protein n=1 Tax=Bipolaricaulis sibiricus TaxID=2501609 RepID=A0A410FS52_BIPS1|nr:MAG: hypothetical protein BIP78_0157 [Candidatus Bipolaricaulis sibiricus]